MSELLFQDVLDATGAEFVRGDVRARLRGVSTDSRTLEPDQLFVALSGPNFDGNRFAGDAARRGAGGMLLRAGDEPPRFGLEPEPAVALVDDPRRALADLATWHRTRLDVALIGITGSCGKTTTKNMLLELLTDGLASRAPGAGAVVGSPASFNNDIGVPHTLLLADGRTRVLVVEMGTNAPGEIAALCRVARPTAGIITNVGAAHLEGLGSIEGVAQEKGELAAAIPDEGFVVLNGDCRWTPMLRETTGARVITFSIDGEGDLVARDVWFHSGGTTFSLNGEREVTLPLLGLHTVQNLLAALGACVGLGLELDAVLPAVERLRDGKRRMQRIEAGGLSLFDDSYNSNPESARASVRVLSGMHGHARRILVLGEMLELGEHSADQHQQVGADAARAGLDQLLLVGEGTLPAATGALQAGMSDDAVLHFPAVEDALYAVPELLRTGDVVLVKGSRATRLERLVERILEVRGPDPTGGEPVTGVPRGARGA